MNSGNRCAGRPPKKFKRKLVAFRFKKSVVTAIRKGAKNSGVSRTRYVEQKVMS